MQATLHRGLSALLLYTPVCRTEHCIGNARFSLVDILTHTRYACVRKCRVIETCWFVFCCIILEMTLNVYRVTFIQITSIVYIIIPLLLIKETFNGLLCCENRTSGSECGANCEAQTPSFYPSTPDCMNDDYHRDGTQCDKFARNMLTLNMLPMKKLQFRGDKVRTFSLDLAGDNNTP